MKAKPKPPKTVKRVQVGATVDEQVKLTLEARGVDINKAIEHFLHDAAGFYTCPTCGAILKSINKGVRT